MIVPLLLVALGAGLARLPGRMAAAALGGFTALLLIDMAAAQNPAYQHDDARGMVQYYADTLGAGDTVLDWSYADRYDLLYYWDRLSVEARRVTLPEGGGLADIVDLLPHSGNVALNVWYTQRADFRGMLNCLYSNGRADLPIEHTVYGMSNLLFSDVTLSLPQMQPLDQPIIAEGQTIATLVSAGVVQTRRADEALCLPVTLRVNQSITSDLHLVVSLRDASGWEILSQDVIFATANQRLTSSAAPGETLTAYALLRAPYGLPPGDYDVLLRVYDDSAPSGYDMLDAEGHVLGKDLPLDQWKLLPGAEWLASGRETTLPVRVDLPVSDDLTLLAHELHTGLGAGGANSGA